jgi:4-hydroxybenzoyl-CoA thioesterase
MPFSTRIEVRFGDADPAGLVYYPIIFHYFHIALEQFFAARCAITYADLMRDERLGFPTVKVETEFLSPLVYGDTALVEVFVSEMGRSSAVFEYAARRESDRVLCARSRQVQVAMNLDQRRAVPIPDKYRAAFAHSQV